MQSRYEVWIKKDYVLCILFTEYLILKPDELVLFEHITIWM